jgi:hypothetical protein
MRSSNVDERPPELSWDHHAANLGRERTCEHLIVVSLRERLIVTPGFMTSDGIEMTGNAMDDLKHCNIPHQVL